MSSFRMTAAPRGGARAGEIGELAVYSRVHDLLVALPVRRITRLVLASEARVLRSGAPQAVDVAGTVYAGWDLGELLGLAALDTAWVLLTVTHGAGTVRVALRTGPCVLVDTLPDAVAIPRRVLLARPRAFGGAFIAPRGVSGAHYGIIVDPAWLLTTAELEASVAAQNGGASS